MPLKHDREYFRSRWAQQRRIGSSRAAQVESDLPKHDRVEGTNFANTIKKGLVLLIAPPKVLYAVLLDCPQKDNSSIRHRSARIASHPKILTRTSVTHIEHPI